MRKLMWFTIGFAVACGLCAYVFPPQWLKLSLIAAGIVACIFGLFGFKFPLYRRAALVFLGCTLGLSWYSVFQSHYLALPAALDGKTETVTIRTVDYSTETSYGVSVEGRCCWKGRTTVFGSIWMKQKLWHPALSSPDPSAFL